ncbi:MAG: AI-2E family transporter [Microscillaceae bacterium]|jgi:predicted PurR-regulated permease PerM|nr:AI-2E family transporter [Microscillaceae bacterium]
MQHRIQLPLHINLVISLFGIILFFFLLMTGAGILIPLAFASFFSLFLYPYARTLEVRGLPRWLAILTCLLVVILLLTIVFSLIYNSLRSFSGEYPQMREKVINLVETSQKTIENQFGLSSQEQLEWLEQNISGLVRSGGAILNNFVNSMTTFFTQIILILIYLYFMLYYRHIFRGFINRVIDHKHRDKALYIEGQIILIIQKYLTGLFTVILIVSVLNIVGLWMIGIKHAIFFGALAGLLTIIPYVGVFIGSLLPILYALVMTDSIFYPILVFAWFQLVQFLEGNFITPNIVGSQVSLNPIVAIVALLLGASIWGVSGMILFTPYTAMLKVLLDNIPELAPYGYLLGEGERTGVVKKLSVTQPWWKFWRKKSPSPPTPPQATNDKE